ncbi:hypothetical protein FGRMN_9874 [Fusarium graminum]|nr:hypothetical protein FGRMN_9874 [Fusarium graminum]
MPSITNMITLACLATAASALPANSIRQPLFKECAKGTWYSSCGEIAGCFDYDPCVEPPTSACASNKPAVTQQEAPATTTAPALTATSAAATATSAAPSETASLKTVNPDGIYEIFPEKAEYAKGKVNGIHLAAYDDKSQVEQAIVFKNIPKGAKDCNFGWRQGPRFSTTFVIHGDDAQADARQLSGFPKDGEDVTYKAVKPFDAAKEIVGGPNFSFWDVLEESNHSVGQVQCAETLYFIAGLRNPKSDVQLFLEQDEHNSGWVLNYTV